MTSPEIRARLTESIQLVLVGLRPGNAFTQELLPENPPRWYRKPPSLRLELDASLENGRFLRKHL